MELIRLAVNLPNIHGLEASFLVLVSALEPARFDREVQALKEDGS